ncbi:MAG: VCBS repeat-containing protein [Planctomycetes bacterium]|nr:VCBS repeat-containing protein [Planctomycetota bacterium]
MVPSDETPGFDTTRLIPGGATPPPPDAGSEATVVPASAGISGPAATILNSGGAAAPGGGEVVPTQLGGYRIVKRIGGGGMGSIYLAVQASVGRQVAIKVLPSAAFDNPEAVERFEREVKVLGQLSHPNICPVLEAGVEGQSRYYVMEHLRGLDLARVLRTQRMDPRRAAHVALQVARALQCAHDRGIVHRDVKPHNVMLLRGDKRSEAGSAARKSPGLSVFKKWFGRHENARLREESAPSVAESAGEAGMPTPDWQDKAVLIDFGLARDTGGSSALTVSGAVVGTPAYMAPEQARGVRRGITTATDVYSLGATLYEMLALRAPFRGETVGAVLQAVMNTDPLPLRRFAPDVDRDLETIVQKAMEKEPARRYAAAGEMAGDLERWLAGEPIRARRASVAYRVRKRLGRNKLASAAIAAAAALAGAGLWMALAPGEIELRGDLAGAKVTLNGRPRTGTVLRVWPPGDVRLKVERDGYREFFQELEVKARSRVPVSVTTPSLFGVLQIECATPGAEAWCDGERLGPPPLNARLPVGIRKIVLRAPRHRDDERSVEVESGVAKPHHVALEHETGFLTVASEPAELGIDLEHAETGEKIFTAAPASGFRLKTGRWTGTAHSENRWPRPVAFEVASEKQTIAGITLPDMVLWKHTSDPWHLNWIAADVNGDRFPDLLVANGKPGRLRALEGRTGRLLWIADGLADSFTLRPLQVDVADLDGDLRPEVVYAGNGEVTVRNAATGKRLAAWRVPKCEGAQAWRDHDGDGLADVFVWASGGVGVLRGRDGARVWWTAVQGSPYPAPARLNGDAFPDVVIHEQYRILGIDGRDGRILWTVPWGAGSYHFAADLNADGIDEVWVCTGARVFRALSGADGTTLWTWLAPENMNAQATAGVADLDGDGHVEIVQQVESGIAIISTETHATVRILATPAFWPRPVFCDLTGDGRPEIVVPSGSSVVAIDTNAGDAIVWRYDLDSRCASTPLLADFDGDGRQDVAVQSDAGVVSVVSAQEPPLRWRQGAPHYFTEHPVPDADPARTLFVPGTPARLLNAADGRVLREWPAAVGFRAIPVRLDGSLAYAIEGFGITMLDPARDAPLWKGVWKRGWSRPLATDLNGDGADDVIYGDQDTAPHVLEALDGRTGKSLWTATYPRPARAGAALAAGRLWLSARDGKIHLLDPATGKETAFLEAGGMPCSVAAAGADVLFATAAGRVARARLADDGTPAIAWSRDTGLALMPYSPIVEGDFAAVAGPGGAVALLDASTGEELWRRLLPSTLVGPPALRDLDGDGRPEAALVATDGRITILRGRDGSDAWAWNLRTEVMVCVPLWCDLDGDGPPELLVVSRDSRVHALAVALADRPVTHWGRADLRSAAQSAGPDREERARQKAREAWREGRWPEALAAAREGRSAESAWTAAMAASKLGDREALLLHSAEARARGCRRLDLEIARASALPPSEAADSLAAALADAPLAEILAAPPAPGAAWPAAAARVQAAAESAGDWPRAVALAETWEAAIACSERGLAAGADPGPLFLTRARAARRLDRLSDAVRDVREAAKHGSAALDAADELRDLEAQARADAAASTAAYAGGDRPRGAALGERAILVLADDPGLRNSLAWRLATSPGATPEDGRRAVEHAQIALDLLAPGDREARSGLLDTLAAAWATAGDLEKAVRAQKEAVEMAETPEARAQLTTRLNHLEKMLEERGAR